LPHKAGRFFFAKTKGGKGEKNTTPRIKRRGRVPNNLFGSGGVAFGSCKRGWGRGKG